VHSTQELGSPRAYPDTRDPTACIVRIHRDENPWRDRLARYWVKIDSVKAGWVRRGGTAEYHVQPGQHRVRLSYSGFLSSKEIVVNAQPGEAVELRCGSGGPALLAPFYWMLRPHRTIMLEPNS
jgi:hypothetical protein